MPPVAALDALEYGLRWDDWLAILAAEAKEFGRRADRRLPMNKLEVRAREGRLPPAPTGSSSVSGRFTSSRIGGKRGPAPSDG